MTYSVQKVPWEKCKLWLCGAFTFQLNFKRGVAALLLTSLCAAAETRLTPSWMTIDQESQTVEMEVVAGFNINNNNWNFNGYYDGNMTAVVPAGWKVRITFSGIDGNYPHSLVVIDDPGAPDNLPIQAGREQVAIRRAYSRDPLGGIYKERLTIRPLLLHSRSEYCYRETDRCVTSQGSIRKPVPR